MTDPAEGSGRWSDERVELIVGNLLRVGVIIAASVALFGGVLYLIAHGSRVAQYSVFRGEPDSLRSVPRVVRDAFHLRSESIVQLGLLLLIATPIARVALSLVAFVRQQDRMYMLVSAIVLGLLLYGLVGGVG